MCLWYNQCWEMQRVKNNKKPKYIYVNINEQTVMLLLIANMMGISKYMLFLLYETFGNDVFLFFEMLHKKLLLKGMTEFRMRRCIQWAGTIAPICKGEVLKRKMSSTELRAYKSIAELLYEDKFRIPEDVVMEG